MLIFPLFDSITSTDGPTNGRTDGRTDKASYRVACPQLKRNTGANFRSRDGKRRHRRQPALFAIHSPRNLNCFLIFLELKLELGIETCTGD